MIHFPARKCYHFAKVAILLLLVVALLTIFEQWRGGKRSAGAMFTDPLEAEYERQILEDEARMILNQGLGEGGVAAHLTGEDKRLGEESEKKLAMNVHLSDRISYNRTLKDYRNPACSRVIYDAELPSASVILIFHNEPYSVVLRTVWSVINSARRDQPWYKHANFVDRDTGKTVQLGYPGQDPSSPFVYLKEIILVDDNSTLPELKGKLSHYVRTRLPPDLIRILRLPDRVGLTQARLAGARYAVGDVLIFLDAHCEPQPDWLRPLLQPIKDARENVVVPIIDVIDSSNFFYSVQDSVTFQGLMSARTVGARAARGQVLVFLDAHCEVSADWLRPLLERIKLKRDAVLTPLIDVVDQTTFELQAAENFQVGGFTFAGHFTWVPVPDREKKRRGSDIAPTWSPTMAGGLFAINRAYYWELGAYDEQMAGWGGENLEMSFRIWQCGGTLETIPCSRVGHVFRSFHPYGLPAASDTHGINTARMAEVWMDEYAELFYLHRPDLRNNPKIGDITHRKVLREKLKCKSFQWYLDNIYKEKFVPVRDVYGYGRFKNPSSGKCLDTLQREAESSPLGVYPCHSTLQATQYFSLALTGELRDEEKCAVLQYARQGNEGDGRRVLLTTCAGDHKNQKWRHKQSGEIVHVQSGLCLDAGHESGDVMVRPCTSAPDQMWTIDYTEDNGFQNPEFKDPPDKVQRLQKLRGHRRISRSLFSFDETPEDNKLNEYMNSNEGHTEGDEGRRHGRRRKHKKRAKKRSNRKKAKNKFILKLIRTLMNGTEEHLEMDIHCSHKRLYPNNTFVRDLVTIFNDNNIKVINNGRVFERNRVTELAHAGTQTGQHGEKVLNKLDVEESQIEQIDQAKQVKKKKHKLSIGPLLDQSEIKDAKAKAGENGSKDQKIIVENFIEVKSSTTEKTKCLKKRKRKRTKTTTAAPALETAPPKTGKGKGNPLLGILGNVMSDLKIKLPPSLNSEENKLQTSMEETPMLASDERDGVTRNNEKEKDGSNDVSNNEERGNSDENWFVGESQFRGNDTPLRRQRPEYTPSQHDSDIEYIADEPLSKLNLTKPRSVNSEDTPVKIVMKSNLTFNLGDEFFAWKKKTGNDVADLLHDMSTVKESPPHNKWQKAPYTPESEVTKEDSSSSSNSDES